LPRKTREELESLKKELKVKTLWSWSKYNTYKTSKYEYFLHYVLHKKEDRIDNIYSVIGGLGHDILERLYTNEIQYEQMDELFEDAWMTASIAELKFDRSDSEKNNKISNKYYANLKHFFNNHHIIPYKLQTEQFIKIKIGTHVFQGYLDGCFKDGDGNYTILDFKTSTIYKGKKAESECGQLLLYAIGLNQLGVHWDRLKICWNFLKYVNVQCEQANGKIADREIERSEIGEKLHSSAKMWLKKFQYSDDDIIIYLDALIQTNNIDCLPNDVKAKFKISDCYVYVDITEELINNLIKDINDTIYEINQNKIEYNKTNDNKIWYESQEEVKKQSYYFANLCGYSANLHLPYKQYLDELDVQKNGSIFGSVRTEEKGIENNEDLSWLNDL
jgi:hypothetical protein